MGHHGPKKRGFEGWGFEGWGAEGWGPEGVGWGAQNFALFFSSPAGKFVLFFPLWVSSRGILVVFDALGPEMCTFGVLWLSCETLAAPKPPAHFSFRPSKTPKFNEKTPRETEKERNGEREKKERNFGRSSGGGSSGAGVRRRVVWRRVVQESKPTKTTTTITTTTPTSPEMEGGGQTQNKCGPEGGGEGAPKGGVPKGGPQRVGPNLPGFRVWVCRFWGSGLNVGLWVFGVWAFLGSENLAKTLKH